MSEINLIDPNTISELNNDLNLEMPKYEDMHIFVELTSHGRDRTVISTNMVINKLELNKNDIGDRSRTYNLLGSNNQNEFTTNWHDNNNDKSNLEGFGIESIKITTNTSFIPQVNIKFVDYRGRTFFNNDNSPYRMLFDFPPPIFKLTVKGFYGQALTYLLHLTKYSTEFKSDNGFFYIDANFVALTFAPLADIPFRYILQFQYLDGQVIDPNKTNKPQNTLELISKIKSLYTNLQNKINNPYEKNRLETISENSLNIKNAYNLLYDMRNDPNINTNALIFKLLKDNNIEIINNVKQYLGTAIDELKTGEINFCVGFKVDEINFSEFMEKLKSFQKTFLNLLNNANTGTILTDIPINTFTNNDGDYLYMKLTEGFIKLNNKKQNDLDNAKTINKELTSKINQMIYTELGMLPTIYNIFEIILNDVDNFFSILRNYSYLAEEEHNKYISTIINDTSFRDVKKEKIYSFPLVINTNTSKRIAPIEMSEKCEKPFPELILIDKFIKSFQKVQNTINKYNEKDLKDEQGNNIWIPISPKDSNINKSSIFNPYFYCNTPQNYLSVLLNRYYAYKDIIYLDYLNDSNIETYADGEACNLANAISNEPNISSNLKLLATDLNKFYDYIKTEDETKKLYYIDDNVVNLGNETYCCDKLSYLYSGGFNVTSQSILPRTNETKGIFDTFFGNNIDSYKFIYQNTKNIVNVFKPKVSSENFIYVEDEGEYKTRFFENEEFVGDKYAIKANNFGNSYFKAYSKNMIEGKDDIYDRFGYVLVNNKDLYLNTTDPYIKMLLITSCFGQVASMFNNITRKNNEFFRIPSVIEMPNFVIKYMSMLSYLTIDDNDKLAEIKNFFLTGDGATTYSHGVPILADLYDMSNSLSPIDNRKFISLYSYDDTISEFNDLNTEITTIFLNKPTITEEEFSAELKKALYFNKYLSNKINFLNFDDQTFKLNSDGHKFDVNNQKIISINSMTSNSKTELDNFFKRFIYTLNNLLVTKEKEKKEKKNNDMSLDGDIDIINQLYYSFKTINDKWLSGIKITNNNIGGYPFNKEGKRLIDSFAFVDRTMNPIGDTIINPEILCDMLDNTDLSVLSVLSSLLSLNNFEFFPLENFMYDYANNWQKTFFAIDNNTIVNSTPSFTCMYLGGSSSYPTGLEQYGFYKEDGILNLTELNEVNDTDETSTSNISQTNNNTDFPWGRVKGFKVKFGEQNQSIFNEIKIDSKEYPETNESIQILARLAHDNSVQEPVPKSQNLYNLYENRAYKAVVNGLGNAMIQPSQYFQLENIPMFNGAYMILGVDHTIVNNRMTTSFTGTKILKYPVPRVKNAASVFGFSGGDTENTATGNIVTLDKNIETSENSVLLDNLDKSSKIPENLSKFTTTPLLNNLINKITSVTGLRTINSSRPDHKGIDISIPEDTNVYSIADGKIIRMKLDHDSIDIGYGYYIIIDHGTNYKGVNYFSNGTDHLCSLYGHLKKLNSVENTLLKRRFKEGDIITEGQIFAKTSNSGVNHKFHLHFGMYQTPDYKISTDPSNSDYAINPTNYFDKNTNLFKLTIGKKNT